MNLVVQGHVPLQKRVQRPAAAVLPEQCQLGRQRDIEEPTGFHLPNLVGPVCGALFTCSAGRVFTKFYEVGGVG